MVKRLSPESLAQEVRRERSAWCLYGARFTRAFPSDSQHGFGAWITIVDSVCSAEVERTARSSAEARRVCAVLRRGGYAVASTSGRRWLFGRRPLRGARELAAEVTRLEALVGDPEAVARLPERSIRSTTSKALTVAVPGPALEYVRGLRRWVWSWAAVERRAVPTFLREAPGWGAVAWCSLLTAPYEDPDFDLGVQLFRPDGEVAARSTELRRVEAAMVAALRPEGYRLLTPRRRGGPSPGLVLLQRSVRGLADARRARARLDALLFEP